MEGFYIVLLMISFIFLFIITIFLLFLIYIIISYILQSISLMSIKEKNSWIPLYNKYLIGKKVNKKQALISTILEIITILLITYIYIKKEFQIIPIIILIINLIITFILDTIISHKIYKKYSKKYSSILTLLNILSLGILRPILIFITMTRSKYGKI